MKKYSMESIVGIFMVVGLLCLGYMTIKLGKISVVNDDSYVLYARFSSVSGLRVDSPVEITGIKVGKVERLSIDQENQAALVALKINNGINIYDDANAVIKTAGLIGDKFVKIEPGGSGSILKPGGTIIDTSVPLDIEDMIGKYVLGDITKSGRKESR